MLRMSYVFFSRVRVYWPEFNGIRLRFSKLSKSTHSNCSECILKYAYALLPFRSRPRMHTPAKQTLWCLTLFTTVIFTFITYYKSPAWLVNVLKNRVSAPESGSARCNNFSYSHFVFFFLFAFLSIYYPSDISIYWTTWDRVLYTHIILLHEVVTCY